MAGCNLGVCDKEGRGSSCLPAGCAGCTEKCGQAVRNTFCIDEINARKQFCYPVELFPRLRYEFEFSANPFFHNKVISIELSFPRREEILPEAALNEVTDIRWKGIAKNTSLKPAPVKHSKKQKVGSRLQSLSCLH